jgi:hypothetical protein
LRNLPVKVGKGFEKTAGQVGKGFENQHLTGDDDGASNPDMSVLDDRLGWDGEDGVTMLTQPMNLLAAMTTQGVDDRDDQLVL